MILWIITGGGFARKLVCHCISLNKGEMVSVSRERRNNGTLSEPRHCWGRKRKTSQKLFFEQGTAAEGDTCTRPKLLQPARKEKGIENAGCRFLIAFFSFVTTSFGSI